MAAYMCGMCGERVFTIMIFEVFKKQIYLYKSRSLPVYLHSVMPGMFAYITLDYTNFDSFAYHSVMRPGSDNGTDSLQD